jgi:hypothetical protein
MTGSVVGSNPARRSINLFKDVPAAPLCDICRVPLQKIFKTALGETLTAFAKDTPPRSVGAGLRGRNRRGNFWDIS